MAFGQKKNKKENPYVTEFNAQTRNRQAAKPSRGQIAQSFRQAFGVPKKRKKKK